ncbi:MAG: hypothetical protein ACM3NF_07240 [Gemmatimonadota bacterium]
MEIRRKAIAIAASAGFLVLMTGAGMSATTGPDSHQAHHPQATQQDAPGVSGCAAQGPAAGGMMGGAMMGSGMMGSGMMGGGMMGRGMMSGTAAGANSPAGCGPAASATIPAPQHAPCSHAAAHGCANATSAS